MSAEHIAFWLVLALLGISLALNAYYRARIKDLRGEVRYWQNYAASLRATLTQELRIVRADLADYKARERQERLGR